MVASSKASVKSFFETGDQPTQAQFSELIDSYLDFNDTLQAIATAAQGGQTGVVIIDSTTDATTASIGTVGKLLITVGTTASAVQHLNAMTLDTTQQITGDKTFNGLFRVSSQVTVRNDKGDRALTLTGSAGTDGAFRPKLAFSRIYGESTDVGTSASMGGLEWTLDASAAAATHVWGQIEMIAVSAGASAGGGALVARTRSGGTLTDRLKIQQGLVVGAPTNGDIGTGAVNATLLYDDGRQVAPSLQAFAWAQVNETGTPAVVNSINIASITDNASGDMSLVFSTAASDAAYGVQIFIGGSTASSPPTVPRFSALHTTTAGGCRFLTLQGIAGASGVDFERVTVTFWDDNPSQGTRVP